MYLINSLLNIVNFRMVPRLLVIVVVFGIVGVHAAEPQTRTVVLNIVDGKVVGESIVRLVQGENAKLLWTSDQSITIHLHGYDIEKLLEPAVETTMAFAAYATGRFPVTVHGNDSHSHGGGERALIYLEVYPE